MLLVIFIISIFIVGSALGSRLARQGITADNALQHHQRAVYCGGLGLLALGTLLGVLLKAGRNSPWVPSILFLYAGAHFWHVVLLFCAMAAGVMLGLEWPGRKQAKRLQQLLLFLGVSLGAIAFLLFQSQPITSLVAAPRMVEGVVLQTTSYSCAAATIATLHRELNPDAETTELEVIKLAGTSRQGTSTLAEIRAMEKLGLEPEYRRNLAIADLVKRDQLAILHVMEPVGGAQIQHAIALLAVDAEKKILSVANPLYGKQIKQFEEMEGYWLSEAVFVTRPVASWEGDMKDDDDLTFFKGKSSSLIAILSQP